MLQYSPLASRIITMMMIACNSRARKGGKERGEYGGIPEKEERNADGATQSATCCTMCKRG